MDVSPKSFKGLFKRRFDDLLSLALLSDTPITLPPDIDYRTMLPALVCLTMMACQLRGVPPGCFPLVRDLICLPPDEFDVFGNNCNMLQYVISAAPNFKTIDFQTPFLDQEACVRPHPTEEITLVPDAVHVWGRRFTQQTLERLVAPSARRVRVIRVGRWIEMDLVASILPAPDRLVYAFRDDQRDVCLFEAPPAQQARTVSISGINIAGFPVFFDALTLEHLADLTLSIQLPRADRAKFLSVPLPALRILTLWLRAAGLGDVTSFLFVDPDEAESDEPWCQNLELLCVTSDLDDATLRALRDSHEETPAGIVPRSSREPDPPPMPACGEALKFLGKYGPRDVETTFDSDDNPTTMTLRLRRLNDLHKKA